MIEVAETRRSSELAHTRLGDGGRDALAIGDANDVILQQDTGLVERQRRGNDYLHD